MIQSKLILS